MANDHRQESRLLDGGKTIWPARYWKRGDIDGAIAHLEKSLRLKFDVLESHNSLTYALFRKGDADAAIAEAHVALNFDPDNGGTHAVLGMALMTKGLLDEAIAQLSKRLRFS